MDGRLGCSPDTRPSPLARCPRQFWPTIPRRNFLARCAGPFHGQGGAAARCECAPAVAPPTPFAPLVCRLCPCDFLITKCVSARLKIRSRRTRTRHTVALCADARHQTTPHRLGAQPRGDFIFPKNDNRALSHAVPQPRTKTADATQGIFVTHNLRGERSGDLPVPLPASLASI